MTNTEMTNTEMTSGDMSSEMTNSEMTSGDMSSEMTDSEMTDSEMTDSEMTDSEMTDSEMTQPEELVVLCAPDGSAAGTAPKATVHDRDTRLHLAFSCYLFDPAGRVLVTRRAYGKRTFPGVRTNSCCGHPAPGEPMRAAVLRRLRQELGLVPWQLDLILPSFRYRASATDGTVENELCPVYRGVIGLGVQVTLQPTEVAEAWWVPWVEFAAQVDGTDPLSWWGAQQVEQLSALGSDPMAWAVGDKALLPMAATP
jgi:isopentenyl-diphosphate Delta-isomerase